MLRRTPAHCVRRFRLPHYDASLARHGRAPSVLRTLRSAPPWRPSLISLARLSCLGQSPSSPSGVPSPQARHLPLPPWVEGVSAPLLPYFPLATLQLSCLGLLSSPPMPTLSAKVHSSCRLLGVPAAVHHCPAPPFAHISCSRRLRRPVPRCRFTRCLRLLQGLRCHYSLRLSVPTYSPAPPARHTSVVLTLPSTTHTGRQQNFARGAQLYRRLSSMLSTICVFASPLPFLQRPAGKDHYLALVRPGKAHKHPVRHSHRFA